MLLKKLCSSVVVSAHFPNALPTQKLDNICVTHQSQVTRRGLSYESVFFSSANISWDTFHCAKRFEVVWEEGPDDVLFEKEPAPPPPEIQNSTSPPSTSGDPIEAGVFGASYWAEDISLVRNQGLEVDDDMEPDPENVPLVNTTDA